LDEDIHLEYCNFLIKFTEYAGEARSEAFIRRTFSILYQILLRGKVSASILKTIMPMLFDRMVDLIDLRYNQGACVALVFQAKGLQTLFFTVGLYCVHFCSFLINP